MSSRTETSERPGGRANDPSDGDIQQMLAKAVRLYAERAAERDSTLPAFASDAVTATEVMVTVTAMLKAVNLQVFELGMWQAWSGR
ncbi:MAG TPA: hypothetical protein VFI98_07500 [Pseudolabrys sp.]|nr:hypothetical protein [Pseudolabrys sp.]